MFLLQLLNSEPEGVESIYHDGQTYLHIPDGNTDPRTSGSGTFLNSLSEFFDLTPADTDTTQPAPQGYGYTETPSQETGLELASQSINYLNLEGAPSAASTVVSVEPTESQRVTRSGLRRRASTTDTRGSAADRRRSSRRCERAAGVGFANTTDGEAYRAQGRNEDILTEATRSIMESADDYFPTSKRMKQHGKQNFLSPPILSHYDNGAYVSSERTIPPDRS